MAKKRKRVSEKTQVYNGISASSQKINSSSQGLHWVSKGVLNIIYTKEWSSISLFTSPVHKGCLLNTTLYRHKDFVSFITII